MSLKAFISYAHSEKHLAARVSKAIDQIGVECFMAHEDIRVNEIWRERILRELAECDLFVALVSDEFRQSEWCSQEAGFAVSRPDVQIFPVMLDGKEPYGFLAQLQGVFISSDQDKVDPGTFLNRLAETIPRKIFPSMIERMAQITSFGEADAAMDLLEDFVDNLEPEEANRLLHVSVVNVEISGAHHYQSNQSQMIPRLLEVHSDHLDPVKVEMLRHQIRTGLTHPDTFDLSRADGESG